MARKFIKYLLHWHLANLQAFFVTFENKVRNLRLWHPVAVLFGEGSDWDEVPHRVLLNRGDVMMVADLDGVLKKQAADVDVSEAEGEIATSNLKKVRSGCDNRRQFSETFDNFFGRSLNFRNIRFKGSEEM